MKQPADLLDQLRKHKQGDKSYRLPPGYMDGLTQKLIDQTSAQPVASVATRQRYRPYWIYIGLCVLIVAVMVFRQLGSQGDASTPAMADITVEMVEDYLVEHSDWIDISEFYTYADEELPYLEDLDLSTEDLLDIIY